MLRRMPVRLKVTLAFTLAMALVLAAVGAVLYARVSSRLDQTINDGLSSRAQDIASFARQGDTDPFLEHRGEQLQRRGESLTQVLDGRGGERDATPLLHGVRLLSAQQLAAAARHTVQFDRRDLRRFPSGLRVRAVPVPAHGGLDLVVVGAELDDRHDALSALRAQLGYGGGAALLLSALIGWLAIAGALRPVESMRRRAAAISAEDTAQRLPVPAARDEIGRLGETLNAMLARLEAALARERRFVADASHELRTPLAVLRTELELALRGPRPAAELEDALRSAAAETDRLTRLAEDLLVLARSDEGGIPVRLETVDVSALLERVRDRFAGRVAGGGRGLTVDSPAGIALQADPLRLEQAIGNLVDNAIVHGAGAIRLDARPQDRAVELHVRDEGPGLPPAFVATAFDRFTRADEARSQGGAGLGLAIVAAITRAHGGEVGSAGADVWIALPRDGAQRPA